jgi:AraC family transcriptional regulator
MSEQIQAIAAALAYIEGHLQENITVADIAAAAGYSLYHFIRTFNQFVQQTPYDYLMRRRLTQAAIALLQSKRRVIDIALDFQFNNHETFTRAFGRVFSVPPSEWRQRGIADPRLLLPALDRAYLEYLHDPGFEPPELLRLDDIILAGLMMPLNADPEGIPSLWRDLRAALRGLPRFQGLRDFWGIRVPSTMPGTRAFYLAAVRIPALESTLVSLVTKILPAGDYLYLPQPDSKIDLDLGLAYLYHTFVPKMDLTLGEPLEIEHFGVRREILIPVQGLPRHNILRSKGLNRSNEPDEPG